MATLRSNRIKKQLFEDDMGDVMKTDVVAPQVGPFNFRPFPHLVIQQSNVDEEAEVNNNFVGSLLHPDVYEDTDCVSTARKPNSTRKYRCINNCATCTYICGQRFCNELNRDMSKSIVEGNDVAELYESLWATEVPNSLEKATSEMATLEKMDIAT
ncbi:unnamed protein product [Prunus armeniaca]